MWDEKTKKWVKKDKDSLWSRTKTALKAGAKAWVDPRKMKPAAEKINGAASEAAKNQNSPIKNTLNNMNKAATQAVKTLKDAPNKAPVVIKNGMDNLKQTWEAFKEADDLGTRARIAQGVGTGVLSGDIFDKPDPDYSQFDSTGPAILYINGMNTPNGEANDDQKAIERSCGYRVARVQNNSSMSGLGDALQVAGQEQGNIDITAIRTAAMIREGLKNRDEIYIIAHSQGTKTFEQALALLTPEERRKIKYQGFGGEQYIDQNKYGLASARNVRHAHDPVPSANEIRTGPASTVLKENWEVKHNQPDVKEGKIPGLLDYHNFRETYLEHLDLPRNPNARKESK